MDGNIIRLSVVGSTNIYTSKLLSQSDVVEWTVVTAESQLAGKGQRGKSWESEKGKNLLCSVVLFPKFLASTQQFLVSVCISVAIVKTLSRYGIVGQIKWPNDVMVDQRKIAGILIENTHRNACLESSVVGIGINANQVVFAAHSWPATSMINCLNGEEVNLNQLLSELILSMKTLYEKIKVDPEYVVKCFNDFLMYRGDDVPFQTAAGLISATLIGVSATGELNLIYEGEKRSFVNGEIKLKRI